MKERTKLGLGVLEAGLLLGLLGHALLRARGQFLSSPPAVAAAGSGPELAAVRM